MSRLIDIYCEHFRKSWKFVVPFWCVCLIAGVTIGLTFGS